VSRAAILEALDALPERLAGRPRARVTRERQAAVLVPVIDDGGPLRLLLTRRADDTPTHKGHVAFPGGMVDPGDADAVDAALRETEEEVGLDRGHVEIVGALDELPTIYDTIAVSPVVGRVRAVPELRPEPAEVARIFDIPFDALLDRDRWDMQEHAHRGRKWPVYYFPWDGETLWGLSAYITLHLLHILAEDSPFEAPFPPPTERP
jgi:8-oxo-dGTP pyrophosphatase MutT (NUDIX family)